jgi:sarcosine oxidase
MEQVDHVVIGAGAMGSATAWWLARAGRSVALVERFEQGHARGSSHGVSRIFRFAYADPRYVRMAMAALPLWRELEDDAGVALLDCVGALDHGPADRIAEISAAMRAAGARHEVLPGPTAEERVPGMRFEESVLFHPDGGRVLADATVRALQDRSADLGADVVFGAGPATLRLERGTPVVEAGGRSWSARTAVVTAGAWVEPVLGDLVRLPPLAVTQEQTVHFAAPGGVPDEWPSFIHHERPWRYGLLSPGQGVKIAGHFEGAVTDPDQRDGVLDAARVAAIERYVERWLPGLVPEATLGTTCLYTTTPTEQFVVDRIGRVVVGSPCSGHGFKFTPYVGKVLADLAMAPERRWTHPGDAFLRCA